MQEINKSRLRKLLAGELPGKEIQNKMAPKGRVLKSLDDSCREAAVLLLIYTEDAQLKIVFIKRNVYEGHHSGQVSLPGGMKEISDLNLLSTALRETEEEIGIGSSAIEILGALTPLYIPVSKICVHPYVGWMDNIPDFKADPTEVQYLICPTLDEVLNQENIKYGTIDHRRGRISTPYFKLDNEIVWGATAMMLNEFISLIGL